MLILCNPDLQKLIKLRYLLNPAFPPCPACPALLQTWGGLVQKIKMKNVLIQEITLLKERFFPKTILLFISGDVLNLFAAERPQQFHQVCWQTYWNINICTPHKIKSVLTPEHPQLPCEWNKSAEKGTDPLLAEFLDCLKPESKPVRATNFKPNVGKTKKWGDLTPCWH